VHEETLAHWGAVAPKTNRWIYQILFFLSFCVWPLPPNNCSRWRIFVSSDHTHWHIHTYIHTHIFSRTPLDEGSVRRRNFYLTTHIIHKRQTSMPSTGFDPIILAT